MMTIETKPWDPAEALDSPEAIAAYLDTYLEDGTHAEIISAIRTAARAKGMTAVADSAGISRQGLYKALGEDGNPSFETTFAILRALGVRLGVIA